MAPCEPWVDPSEIRGWPTQVCDLPDQIELVTAATELVWARSGQQFGLCTVTVRPCGISTVGGSTGWDAAGLTRFPGVRWPWPWDACAGACACSGRRMLDLPGGPVVEILAVEVDGVTLDPAEYRVAPPRTLIRTDAAWPCTQNLTAELGEPNTFGVTYTYGVEPPVAGRLAVRALAMELAKAVAGDGSCQLPARVTEVSRQSVSVAVESVGSLMEAGMTGVPAVDLFVASVNPTRAVRSGRIRNPDRPSRFQVETLGGS